MVFSNCCHVSSEVVEFGHESCKPTLTFSDFVEIINGVSVCSVLSDNELFHATLSKDNAGSNIEGMPLCRTAAEAFAALSVLEGSCFYE